jgi:hypothetical protein
MLAEELWKITGYRFTLVLLSRTFFKIKTHLIRSVYDNQQLKRGFCMHFWCSQDAAWKKPLKPSENPNAKHHA